MPVGEAGRLRPTEVEVVVAPYRLTGAAAVPSAPFVAASPVAGGIRSNYRLRLEGGPPAGGAALQDELFEKPVRLFHLTVAQFGPHPPAGHVKVDTGQVERSLNGPLDPPHALDLFERDPCSDLAKAARGGSGYRTVGPRSQEMVAERGFPKGPLGWLRQRELP